MAFVRQFNNEKIYKNTKAAHILSIFSFLAAILTLITALITNYSVLTGLFSRGIFTGASFILISVLAPINIILITSIRTKSIKVTETKNNNDFANILTVIIISLLPILYLFFLWIIFISFGNDETDKINLMNESYFVGYMIPAYVFTWIADAFLVHTIILIKQEYKKNPPNYAVLEQKIKQEKLVSINKQKDFNNYNRLIVLVGMNFFVKYYYQVRDLTFADAIDEITETYSFEEKKSRIQSSKEIFKLKLERFVLEQIAKSQNESLSLSIKNEATNLLGKEFEIIIKN